MFSDFDRAAFFSTLAAEGQKLAAEGLHPPLERSPEAPVFGGSPKAMCGALYDERMALHLQGTHEGHPEAPARIGRIWSALEASGFMEDDNWVRLISRKAGMSELTAVHSQDMVANVLEQAKLAEGEEVDSFDAHPHWEARGGIGDAAANRHSPQAALLAAGCAIELACKVCDPDSNILNGFACVRPPGHHACSNQCSGFCLFNNVPIAALAAQKKYGVERILILDWDVHHGDGTVEVTSDNPNILYISLHNFTEGFYPGTGDPLDTGNENAQQNDQNQ
jgi:acetoin utilization deacetylase AcuC-like enzyme